MVDAMTRPKAAKPWQRSPTGATASARLLRWPTRNYFGELEPTPKEGHPVDDMMERDPGLRRLRRQAHRHLARLQGTTASSAVLDFEAARNHLDSARVETAFNIGYEGGLVAGIVAGFGRARGTRREANEVALVHDIRRTVVGAGVPRARIQAVLLELSLALALEPPVQVAKGRREPRAAVRPRRSRRTI